MKKSMGAKTVVYPTPVFVVGTYDGQGKANVMTAAWGGICCSRPPRDDRCLGRYLLLTSTLCSSLSQGGYLYLRKYCGAKGIYNQHSVAKLCQGS
jgi:hypothetical protein